MDALLRSYLLGLKRLENYVKKDSSDYDALYALQVRMKENIEKIRTQGDTKDIGAERVVILSTANEITLRLFEKSFEDYCQLDSIPIKFNTSVVQRAGNSAENTMSEVDEIIIIPSGLSGGDQQPMDFLVAVKEYVTVLRESVKRAKDTFNNSTNIDRELCEDALSPFHLFDCSSFPEHSPSLLRAKVRLQHLNEQVKELIELCEVCDSIDQPSRSLKRKIKDLIGSLDSLLLDVISVQTLLNTVDVEMST